MTDRVALFVGIAQHLADHGLVRYAPTGIYPPAGPTDPPAAYYRQRPDTPADAVTITVYDENYDRDDGNPDVYVQLHYRRAGTDPRIVDQYAETVRETLHDRSRFTLPNGIGVKLCRRKIAGMSDPDTSGRWSRPDSYVFTLDAKAL